ncbi:MAG TPA: hypothetical protein VFW65_31850 [Pseudonocardiaceae bacterium]|nr:hypothetical protein [Pseudonocardiaceae bacterium]
MRNPGVTLLWTTTEWDVRPAPGGVLWHFGDPIAVAWMIRGRAARRPEVVAALHAGMPALRQACELDEDPSESRVLLAIAAARLMRYVPHDQPAVTTGRWDVMPVPDFPGDSAEDGQGPL